MINNIGHFAVVTRGVYRGERRDATANTAISHSGPWLCGLRGKLTAVHRGDHRDAPHGMSRHNTRKYIG